MKKRYKIEINMGDIYNTYKVIEELEKTKTGARRILCKCIKCNSEKIFQPIKLLSNKCKCQKPYYKLNEKIYDLYYKNMTNREIANSLNISHSAVAYWLKKKKLKSNWANQPINIIDSDNAKCSKCNKIYQLKEFQYGRKGQKYEYKFSYCNKCRKKQSYENLNKDVKKFLKNRYNILKRRSERNNIKFEISFEYFLNIYFEQNGLCFYIDKPLRLKVGKGICQDSFSVDKIEPHLGYIEGNIVFCTRRINTIKNNCTLYELQEWMPKFYRRIMEFKEICGNR